MRDIGPKIKARREKLGWTVTKLATLAGISGPFLSRIENGKATGGWDTYSKIAGALGVSTDVFLRTTSNVEPAQIGWRKIPILDYLQAGHWNDADGIPKDEEIRETVMTDLEYPSTTFGLRIRGDAMEPEFREGDIVIVSPTVNPKPGDCVVATEPSGEATFRQYRSAGVNERGEDVFLLHPLNPLYADMRSDHQLLVIVGTMVEHRRYRRRRD